MSERLGRPVAVQRGWDYLQRLRHSPQVPRPRHIHADPAAQARFKKSSARS
jgi:winged helix-turn-helix protein